MKSDTPITDAAESWIGDNASSKFVRAEIARTLERELNEVNKCFLCKGKGGFDSGEDCYECAMCEGTGKLDHTKLKQEFYSLIRQRDSSKNQLTEYQAVAKELFDVIDDCKGHGMPIIKDRAACYLAMHRYTKLTAMQKEKGEG